MSILKSWNRHGVKIDIRISNKETPFQGLPLLVYFYIEYVNEIEGQKLLLSVAFIWYHQQSFYSRKRFEARNLIKAYLITPAVESRSGIEALLVIPNVYAFIN
jgi:hypothetical protein